MPIIEQALGPETAEISSKLDFVTLNSRHFILEITLFS